MILLHFGWMVDLAMSIFEFLTKFLIFWHPWHPWVCICSDLKPLFETDMSDSSYSVCWKWNLKQIEAIPPSVIIQTTKRISLFNSKSHGYFTYFFGKTCKNPTIVIY